MSFDCLVTAVISGLHLMLIGLSGKNAIVESPFSIGIIIAAGTFLFAAGGLACYHTGLASNNITTREDGSRNSKKEAKLLYRRGKDWTAVCCAPDRIGYKDPSAAQNMQLLDD